MGTDAQASLERSDAAPDAPTRPSAPLGEVRVVEVAAPESGTPARAGASGSLAFGMARLDGPIVVTIDGPAGTGKSSVARALALRLGLDFLDTGAMYRAAAAIVIDEGLSLDDPGRVVARVREANIRFNWREDPPQILAFDRPLDRRIREADVTAMVSPISALPDLRALMVAKQRAIAEEHPRLVTEGRDQGTAVFDAAPVKFYLTARPEVRARRRTDQLRSRGIVADERRILDEIRVRDHSDASRATGPLRRPDDAIEVDTSDLTELQVVETLERLVRDRAER